MLETVVIHVLQKTSTSVRAALVQTTLLVLMVQTATLACVLKDCSVITVKAVRCIFISLHKFTCLFLNLLFALGL